MMKSRISLKPCPFCGASVSAFRGTGNVTFFLCSNEECRALVSFGGNKQVAPDAVEAENPINNFNRRADNGTLH
ncbi:MAG: hypothetical protein OSJ43_14845 [Oscillospiraceae bacterium]|nr:hypothetical protein [Oscillospiraceae bacterium]